MANILYGGVFPMVILPISLFIDLKLTNHQRLNAKGGNQTHLGTNFTPHTAKSSRKGADAHSLVNNVAQLSKNPIRKTVLNVFAVFSPKFYHRRNNRHTAYPDFLHNKAL